MTAKHGRRYRQRWSGVGLWSILPTPLQENKMRHLRALLYKTLGHCKGERICELVLRGKKEKGVTCRSRNYSEEKLMEICTVLMGIETFDEEIFERSVKGITVLPNGSIILDGKIFCGVCRRHSTKNIF